MAETIDPRLMLGTKPAEEIVAASAGRARAFLRETGAKPCLAAVLVGDIPPPPPT